MKKPLPEPPIPEPHLSGLEWARQIHDWMKEMRDTLEEDRQADLRRMVDRVNEAINGTKNDVRSDGEISDIPGTAGCEELRQHGTQEVPETLRGDGQS